MQKGPCATHLHALDLQLHVVLSRRLPILPLLPAVPVLPVLHLLPVVQNDAAILRPVDTNRQGECEGALLCLFTPSVWSVRSAAVLRVPCFQGAGEPLIVSIKRYQVRSDFLQE